MAGIRKRERGAGSVNGTASPADDPVIAALGRPLRLGVIGGGPGAMIGPMHRRAAVLDGRFAIAAGVLSAAPERARQAGLTIGLAAGRAYGTSEEMLEREAARADGIEAVSIMTPNASHHRLAAAAIERGLDVIIEKPLVNTVPEANDLLDRVQRAGTILCVTHPYAAYPMIREARALIGAGSLGAVRAVEVSYLSGGLARRLEETADGVRRWRLDPEISGPSLVLGDLGTHAHHLLSFVLDEPPFEVRAELTTLVPGRLVHDHAELAVRFRSGARGRIGLSQAATGQTNAILLRVIGERASLEWRHAQHAELTVMPSDGPRQTRQAGAAYLSADAKNAVRLGRTGHPEGLLEAFANLYSEAALAIAARRSGKTAPGHRLFPDVLDGARGVWFAAAAIASNQDEHRWKYCQTEPVQNAQRLAGDGSPG
ncbi:MAG: Gfo/Idh/MocA family protein [Acetobacteraceae bacterium]